MGEFLGSAATYSFSFGGLTPLVGIVGYVISSLALYELAQRRGIRAAWLAWVPVLSVWILGSLSDQYHYVVRGEIRSRRKVLLTVRILSAVLSVVMTVRVVFLAARLFMDLNQGMTEQQLLAALINGALQGLLWSLPALILGLVGMVLEYMALYDVFASCEPASKTLYLVLSVIPVLNQVTRPLFLFLCRDKDGGMPPRRNVV